MHVNPKTHPMKKFVFTTLTILAVIQVFGQLNPVKNLIWTHEYEMPNNCFSLSWSEPDTSLVDTLVGYNIYRDSSLYRFTTERQFSCNPCIGVTYSDFCDFIFFNNGYGFEIIVKAVYNGDEQESGYTESAFCNGILIGIKESDKVELNIFPNPTSGKVKVEMEGVSKILIYNEEGLLITEVIGKSEIDLNPYPLGVYFLKIYFKNDIYTETIILRE